MVELKKLGERNIAAAMDLAKHYRNLNEPEEAESICRDILAVVPDHDEALRTLGLALTDKFPTHWMTVFEEATETFAKLASEYDRVYYTGIAWERYAKVVLERGRADNALHAFDEALRRFAEAERIGPKDSPAPILRFNSCVREMKSHPDLLKAAEERGELTYEFGD